jgi:hypothetical protein
MNADDDDNSSHGRQALVVSIFYIIYLLTNNDNSAEKGLVHATQSDGPHPKYLVYCYLLNENYRQADHCPRLSIHCANFT